MVRGAAAPRGRALPAAARAGGARDGGLPFSKLQNILLLLHRAINQKGCSWSYSLKPAGALEKAGVLRFSIILPNNSIS